MKIYQLFSRNFLALMLSTTMIGAAQTSITVSGTDTGRIFEGIGVVSAGGNTNLLMDYPEPYRSDILDFLFKPKFGAGFQHLKVEIGGGENSTCGSEPSHAIVKEEKDNPKPRGYEFWLMSEARKRNPKIILDCLPWSYPAWCEGPFTQNTADWYVSFLNCAKKYYGLDLDYVGAAQNEKYMKPGWVTDVLRPTLDKAGYGKIKLHGPDSNGSYWEIFDKAEKDPANKKVLDMLAATSYHIYDLPDATEKAKASGKPLWMSEGTAGRANELRQFIRFYVKSRITKFETWPPAAGCYEGNTYWANHGFIRTNQPWSGNYEIYDAVWLAAHITQFTDIGWKFLDSSCILFHPEEKNSDAGCIMLKDPKSEQWSLIAATTKEPINLVVNIKAGLSAGPIHVWKSSLTGDIWKEGQNKMLVQQSDLSVKDGKLVLYLEANSVYSITTTNHQVKGIVPHLRPNAARFPIKYSENFEDYKIGNRPKWFMDQEGNYEVIADGRGGKCLKQIIPVKGTAWAFSRLKPHTLFGDYLRDSYELSADVKIIAGDAEIGGHLEDTKKNLGYRLTLNKVGKWTLSAHTTVIDSGNVAGFDSDAWHGLKLSFFRNQLAAFIDGVEVAKLADAKHSTRGLCFLGSTYDPNLFDNVHLDCLDIPLERSGMKATATSSLKGDYDAVKVLDGDLKTMWHSANPSSSPLPQSITIDFGKSYEIKGIGYVPRAGGTNGIITEYNLYTSLDGKEFKLVASGKWNNNAGTKYIDFPATKAAFIKLEAIAGMQGFASATEIYIYESLTK
jgi:galactosylceramidase